MGFNNIPRQVELLTEQNDTGKCYDWRGCSNEDPEV